VLAAFKRGHLKGGTDSKGGVGAYLKGGAYFFSIFGLDNQAVVEVTGARKLENGVVIPRTFNV